MDEKASPPHVLIIPVPAQGHINSMLRLAELLCAAGGFQVTFLTTASFHRRLLQHSDVAARFSRWPFLLESIPNGLLDDYPRGRSLNLKDYLDAFRDTAQPFLKDLLLSNCDNGTPITCVISDGVLSFVLDVAEERGVPVFYFRTVSACAFWAYFCATDLIKAKELPFNSDDLDMPIVNMRGMEGILRRRDLPSCFRSELNSTELQLLMYETLQTPRAKGLILNTFDHLERATLDHIQTQIPNLYTIGPLHAHLKTRKPASDDNPSNSSSSLWEEDRSCLKWLDEQPSKSVIYVSFGSLTVVTSETLMEFWHGLMNSGKRFLWVIRPEFVNGEIPAEVLEGTAERWCVVGWAPQEEVLAHVAVVGFFTHCGWNSILESVVAGVPMIGWPYFADQQINSRFVDVVWKLGLDMKDCCDRVTIEKMVRDVMEGRRDEFMERARDLAKLARESVEEGGMSYSNVDRLIGDIRLLVNQG